MKELLFSVTKKDLDVQVFRSGGKGGQHQNKVSTGVRLIHRDSGAVGESRRERSQLQNKKLALRHLVDSPKFQIWIKKRVWEVTSKMTLEQRIEELMKPEHLKIEIWNGEQWLLD